MLSQCKWPSATAFFWHKIGLVACLPQEQFEGYDRNNYIGARAWHDQLIDRASLNTCLAKEESSKSLTVQLLRSCPQALQVATYSQQVVLLEVERSYPSSEVQLACSTAPADWTLRKFKFGFAKFGEVYQIWEKWKKPKNNKETT